MTILRVGKYLMVHLIVSSSLRSRFSPAEAIPIELLYEIDCFVVPPRNDDSVISRVMNEQRKMNNDKPTNHYESINLLRKAFEFLFKVFDCLNQNGYCADY